MKFSPIVLITVAMLSVPMAAPFARACMVCVADPMERVLVTELQGSEETVLARPSIIGAGRAAGKFQITRVLKGAGNTKPGMQVTASLPLFSEDGGKMGLGTVLLTRRAGTSDWMIRAPAAALYQLSFFKQILSLPPAKIGENVEDDARRTTFFLRFLHHLDPVLARSAAAEIAEAPYPVLKAVKEKLDVAKIRAELRNPAMGERRALFYTLLGVCGNEEDAAAINQSLDAMWDSNGSKHLAALLTARLELEGETAVDAIEARYFRDRDRTLPEIEAAILALRVHGDTDATISRDRVIKAYRTLFDDREPLVFYIAGDLARWEDWESRDRLVAIAQRRGDALPEIRQRVDEYLTLLNAAGNRSRQED